MLEDGTGGPESEETKDALGSREGPVMSAIEKESRCSKIRRAPAVDSVFWGSREILSD